MDVPGLREILVHIRDMASDTSDDMTGLGRPRIIAGLARRALHRFFPQSEGEPTTSPHDMEPHRADFDAACAALGWVRDGPVWRAADGACLLTDADLTPGLFKALCRFAREREAAVLAEREACARVAETAGKQCREVSSCWQLTPEQRGVSACQAMVCEGIAAAIREGKADGPR